MDIFDKMLNLARQGFFCAQILLILALEAEGKEDPDLVRAMGGLNGGLCNSGGVCGALTGGACLLSYFAGKGEADEIEHPRLDAMGAELSSWFEEYASEYGSTTCLSIMGGDPRNKMQRCPLIVQDVFEKCMELLEREGVL